MRQRKSVARRKKMRTRKLLRKYLTKRFSGIISEYINLRVNGSEVGFNPLLLHSLYPFGKYGAQKTKSENC